jgi:isoquinoline 1-oxidoreductase beta subunit
VTAHESINRRDFLSVALLAGGSLVIAFRLPAGDDRRDKPASRLASLAGEPVSVWLKVSRDSRLTFVNPHAEMGQGIWSSLAMVFVDEFGADWELTGIEAGTSRPEFRLNPYVREVFTAGSSSVATGYLPVREAAAAARQLFLTAAAARLGAAETDLTLADSRVHSKNGGVIAIGELLDDVLKLQSPTRPMLKDAAALRHVGRGLPAKDIPDKAMGKALYGIDYREPGMLIATVKTSPVHGGRVVSSNAVDVRRMRGVRRIVEIPHGLAVVADTFWHAKKAADALQIKFDAGGAEGVDDQWYLDAHGAAIRRTDGVVGFNDGDTLGILAASTDVHEATFFGPWLAHATMEPMSCSARVTADRADLWLGTQGIEYVTNEVARVTGLTVDKVHVHNLMLGGGFGRRYEADYPIQAAIIAKSMPGTAVKVIWTREEDMQQDYCRPAGMALLRATLDAHGMPAALLVRVSAPAIAAHNPGFEQFAKPVDITAIDGFVNMHYELPNKRFEWVQTESHLKIGWWRSVGNSQNAFFKECFIDELAEKAAVDPIEYRLRMLSGDKHAPARRLLQELARASSWGSAPTGHFQGVALHDTFGTLVGEVVELSLTGTQIAVKRVTCAYDCGSVINPGPVDAQMRGSIIWGLTAALMGEINVERGRIKQSNFHDYRVLLMSQVPEIDVIPVLRGGAPSGIGEPGVPPVMPAVVNAMYRATGKRFRRLPLSKFGFTVA